mmetsp:Transcript_37008/g.99779  ORF Transcript_37008/g.99779 Transcript_37008/m.99779 type:complete len:266 (+) Transcript_37008:4106-4903(+)
MRSVVTRTTESLTDVSSRRTQSGTWDATKFAGSSSATISLFFWYLFRSFHRLVASVRSATSIAVIRFFFNGLQPRLLPSVPTRLSLRLERPWPDMDESMVELLVVLAVDVLLRLLDMSIPACRSCMFCAAPAWLEPSALRLSFCRRRYWSSLSSSCQNTLRRLSSSPEPPPGFAASAPQPQGPRSLASSSRMARQSRSALRRRASSTTSVFTRRSASSATVSRAVSSMRASRLSICARITRVSCAKSCRWASTPPSAWRRITDTL